MYDRIKGFRDFYPEEMAVRRETTATLEETARRYGFREVGTPALESTQMYIDKSGEEIVDELFSFTDRGGRAVALTPELTPTLARMVVAKQQALTKPIKWYSTRPFWRYEEPQQGRFREFYQTNVDIFGSASPAADAEVLAWAADALTALGLDGDDFEFRVSHRDLLGGLLTAIAPDVDVASAIRAVDKREKAAEPEYRDLLADAGLEAADIERFDAALAAGDDDLEELIDLADSDRVRAATENLQNVLEMAERFGVRDHCTISLETARGLDYYTGVVFECFDVTGAVSRSIFGGGRYDDLIEGFGGQPLAAVGVAPGHATLHLLLAHAGVIDDGEPVTDYYVLTVGDTYETAASLVQTLRGRGNVVETDVSDRSFGAQLEYADAIGARTVVIVGERDLAEGQVTVKDMETGEQVTAPCSEFPGDRDRPTIDDFR